MNKEVEELLNKLEIMEEAPLIWISNKVPNLFKENKQLKKQLEYLRSEEYLNQLKFERNMLENIVQNMEVSREDKQFIDMTHRNTELLEENKHLKNNWNSLKESLKFDIELYDTILLHRKMTSDKVLKEMEELEMSNNNLSEFFRVTGDYKYMWVDGKIYNELKNHISNGGYIFIECPYQKPIKLKVVEE